MGPGEGHCVLGLPFSTASLRFSTASLRGMACGTGSDFLISCQVLFYREGLPNVILNAFKVMMGLLRNLLVF